MSQTVMTFTLVVGRVIVPHDRDSPENYLGRRQMHRNPCPRRRFFPQVHWILIGFAFLATAALAGIDPELDPKTGLKRWIWHEQGVSIQLAQRLPDQTRGFFLARGFSADQVDRIATACVMQTIFRNDGDRPVSYDLDDWRVVHAGQERPLNTREYWDRQWRHAEVSQAARIALRWSLLPTRQQFQPGDYNWGMSSYGLPPGSRFDIQIVVNIGGHRVEHRLRDIECAQDRTGK